MALQLQNPSSILLAGPSGVGKTFWVFRFIDHINEMLEPKPTEILYFYHQWQPIFEQYLDKITFKQGLPTLEALGETKECKLVILDDLMHENSDIITKIFTIYSHHQNFTVLETVQNLFHKSHRTISLNAKIVILFKHTRDVNQIKYFLRQAFTNWKGAFEAYKDATKEPRGYLALDFRCDTPDDFRIRSSVFPGETNFVYQ